jgi:hypothetical protein
VVGTSASNVSEAQNAVGLSEEVADLGVERTSLLVELPSLLVVRTFESDVPEALDAVGLSEEVADLDPLRGHG